MGHGEPPPIFVWHGLGDSCKSPIMDGVIQALEGYLKRAAVPICVGETGRKDAQAGVFGDANEHVRKACEQVTRDKRARNGYLGLGFSQGGLFMRALAQRCEGPPMLSLVTLGSPHEGVADLPGCPSQVGWAGCALFRRLVWIGAYSRMVRNRLVPAQYYKDPLRLEDYRRRNPFLPSVNCEQEQGGEECGSDGEYARRLRRLCHLVLVRFGKDKLVVPKDSAWFADFNATNLIPLRQQASYKQDLLGLRSLDDSSRLSFVDAPYPHMAFPLSWFRQNLAPFLNLSSPSCDG